MRFFVLVALLACFLHVSYSEKIRYDGHQVIRFYPESRLQTRMLSGVRDASAELQLDFWSDPSMPGNPVDIRVAPHQKSALIDMAARLGLKYDVLIEDVQSRIDAQKVAPPGSKLSWDAYYEVDDILGWVGEQAEANDFATLEIIGQSYQERDIPLLRINKPSDGQKVGIYIESQIHAREWVTSATTTWIINEFLNNPEYADVLDKFDIHYVPIVNPDGTDFTHTNDRLWRKTRSNYGGSCYGADPNRNWDATFGGPGTSSDPCSDLYHGPEAFSESETKAVSEYLSAHQDEISLFVDVHSYSQLVLLPWGDTSSLPDDYDELYAMGKVFEDNVKILYGTEYITGNIADVIYLAAGGSVDWVKASTSIKYSQALELRDTGDYGFLLPSDQIVPSGEETLMGLLAEMNAIRDAVLARK